MSNSQVLGQLRSTGSLMNIEWEIADFLLQMPEVEEYFDSPVFLFADSSWFLRLYPNGEEEESSLGYIGLYLLRKEWDPPVSVTYRLFLKNTDGRKEVVNKYKQTFNVGYDECGNSRAIKRSDVITQKSKFMPLGVLTVICSFRCDETQAVRDPPLLWSLNTTMSNSKVTGQLKGARDPVNIQWEIANFLSLPAGVNEWYESSLFFFCDAAWQLKLYPNGREELGYHTEGSVGLYLLRKDWGPSVSVIVSIFLKKTDGRKKIAIEEECIFHTEDMYSNGWVQPEVIKRSKLIQRKSQFLPSGILTVICCLKCNEEVRGDSTIPKESTKLAEVSTRTQSECGTEKLARDLRELLQSGKDSDLTVRVKGVEFHLHRAILGARTPVFGAMFTHDMKEKATGIVSLDDCGVDVFRAFVQYIYSGRADELSTSTVFELFALADKYQADELKADCFEFIQSTLSLDTFCRVVSLALTYKQRELLDQATDYFAGKMEEVLQNVEWMTFLTEHPIQANELILKAVQKRNAK